MKATFRKSGLWLLFACVAVSAEADLVVQVHNPQITGSKAVVKLELKNTYHENIESARASAFLVDQDGKLVGQATRWVIGGGKGMPALVPGGTNTFSFVVGISDSVNREGLTAKLMFSRVVLEGGKLADVRQGVRIRAEK